MFFLSLQPQHYPITAFKKCPNQYGIQRGIELGSSMQMQIIKTSRATGKETKQIRVENWISAILISESVNVRNRFTGE